MLAKHTTYKIMEKQMRPFSKNMFESELAEFYDLMRQYRDYDLESKFADIIIQNCYPNAKNVLDIFCGTGEHAIKMAQRGYVVTGIDASQDMINLAEEKTKKAGVSIDYHCTDIKNFIPTSKYDAAYCLGYTFLYMLTHSDVLDFFKIIHDILVPEGVFLVDFINGWSLIKGLDRDKYFYQNEKVKITQFEQLTLNKQERLIHIEYCYLLDYDNGHVKTISAEEDVRIFFDDEVQTLMNICGFNNIKSYGDYKLADKKSADVPNIVIVVGQKK